MTRAKRSLTEKIEVAVEPPEADPKKPAHCPYCKKELPLETDTVCPFCNLPLRRRRRRQITSGTGPVSKIMVHQPGAEDREVALLKKVVTLGRHPANMIHIESPLVSNEHAKIEFTTEGHTLTDVGSTNGTRVNGQPLTPHKPHLLTDQAIIRLSDSRGNSVQLTYLAPSGYSRLAADKAGHAYQLKGGTSHIGRGFDADIVLSHPAVSWYHAKVTHPAEGHYLIEDVSTHDATFLNGLQLQHPQRLAQGDVIGIGPFNLIYQGQGRFSSFIAERNFNLEVSHLEKTVYGSNWLGLADRTQPKQILRNVDLDINPREFVALVGGSGSGKSTLLKALIGLSPATGGKVLVNGNDLYEHLELYRHLIGYVPQDDIIHQDLSVREALRYALQLRLPDRDPKTGEQLLAEVLEKVGLTAHAATLVRDLSGGQRKRVSIAAELLADPWIFFLDEPTSGLDPGLEKLMMDTLRHLADEGRTIVLITHATNHIIAQCDQAVFMTGGEVAYFGPPDQAMAYFGVDNFPDIYTVLAQPPPVADQPQPTAENTPPLETNIPLGWGERYRHSELYETYISHREGGEVARPILAKNVPAVESTKKQLHQFKVLARRYMALLKANRLNLGVLGGVMPLIAFFLLLISNPRSLVGHNPDEIVTILETVGRYTIAAETQTILFMLALTTTLLGIFSAGYEFIKETAIYQRERMLGLEIWPYFASKFGVLGGIMAGQLILFLLMLALKLRFPAQGALMWAPLEYYLTLLLTVLASIALGLFISSLVSSKDMVVYLILLVIVGQIIFSGAIFALSPLTAPLSYLTITRWSLEALGLSTNIEALNALGQVRVENVLDTGRGLQTLVKDIPTTIDFHVNYTRNPLALLSRWAFLVGHILVWSQLAVWQLRRKEEVGSRE